MKMVSNALFVHNLNCLKQIFEEFSVVIRTVVHVVMVMAMTVQF